ncbi:MAG: ABC transporter permease [Lachnospiraceae bacterium]|nr:ABC transporter permease [Lachnospiraceae bacterium]
MTQLKEYVKMALDNIRANKGRSVLTMLGIIIGISSVIMIISLGNGAKGQISDELNGIAGGQVYLYANTRDESLENPITYDDMMAIKEQVEHVKAITIDEMMFGNTSSSKGEFEVYCDMGTEDLKYVMNSELKYGSYFTNSDVVSANNVCVIDETSAVTLFGTSDVVGMDIDVTLYGYTRSFRIVGVSKVEDGDFFSMSYGSDIITLEIPYTTADAIIGYTRDEFEAVYVVAEEPKYSKQVAEDAIRLLEKRNKCAGQDAYLVQSFEDEMGSIMQVLDLVTYFIVFVAAISLLVGGIGVMNIMLVSVTERTREIGIRKALGARTRSIMMQFLAESAIITLIGGAIGIVLGIGGAELICLVAPISPRLSVSTVVIATLFSSGVGIFFGIYPAKKAAKMSPIEALRFQ